MRKIKTYFWGALGLFMACYFLYRVFRRGITDYMLKENTVLIKAIIIDEKNYYPHSYVTHDFAYSYMFIVYGKTYKNNSHNIEMKVGDSLEIEYSKNYPSINRSLHTTD